MAIDTLTMGSEVMPFDEEVAISPPDDGVYIYGIFIEGARFDREALSLQDSFPGRLFDRMPYIWWVSISNTLHSLTPCFLG